MPDYRPVHDETTFRELVQYAFSPEEGPFDPASADATHDVGDRRGVYDGDRLLAVCRHYELPVELRGDVVESGGVGSVASDPGRRREGNVRALLAASLADYRDRGWRLASLWPFDVGFYAEMGWATVSKLVSWEIDPADLDGLAAAPLADAADTPPGDTAADGTSDAASGGQFERLTADDWQRLEPVQRATHDTALAVRRDESWWREFVFDGWNGTPYVYGWIVDGEVRGYLVYHVERTDGDHELVVRERGAVDTAAHRQLFRFCRDHDSQVDRVRFYTTADAVVGDGFDPHRYLDDPAACDGTVVTGAMTRLVDVAADLPAVAGPAVDDRSAQFDLVVSDPIAPWNDGRFRVTTDDDALTVAPVGDAADAASATTSDEVPTVRLGIGALSQVVVGARGAEELARAGRIGGDDTAITALGACFPPGRPAVHENF